jgi:hypothetical protein
MMLWANGDGRRYFPGFVGDYMISDRLTIARSSSSDVHLQPAHENNIVHIYDTSFETLR